MAALRDSKGSTRAPIAAALPAAILRDARPSKALFVAPGAQVLVPLGLEHADQREPERAQRRQRIVFAVALLARKDRNRRQLIRAPLQPQGLQPAPFDTFLGQARQLGAPSAAQPVEKLDLSAGA